MPVPWNGDDPRDLAAIGDNLRRILTDIVGRAARRDPPSLAMARDWHRRIYRGVTLPVPYYAGEVRDSDPDLPELDGYEVTAGANPGVPAHAVPAQLATFERFMIDATGRLDAIVESGTIPTGPGVVYSILTLCAIGHGEWIRIHPFANGNGRTARLWANWCAARYGLPPFVRLRPRPAGDAYGLAAADSMHGDHRPMIIVLADLLEQSLETTP